MAFLHGKGTKVLFHKYDLSSFLNDSSFSRNLETGETTTYGKNSKTYIVGQGDGTVSLSGMFDASAGAVDEVLSLALVAGADSVASIGTSGFTLGNAVMMINSVQNSYEVSSPVADVVSVSAELQSNGDMDTGKSLKDLASVTATGNQSSVDNAASSLNGGVAHLHVTVNAQLGNTVVLVQHSADNSTWATLVTFATVATTVLTSQRVEVAAGTTVNRYLRASYTLGSTGGVTFQVSFARR